jgi:hypothetical protein
MGFFAGKARKKEEERKKRERVEIIRQVRVGQCSVLCECAYVCVCVCVAKSGEHSTGSACNVVDLFE